MALTIFAFNNTTQQYAIRAAGGIKYSVFEPFIESMDEFHNCYAAFQVRDDKVVTVKPPYFRCRSFENPRIFEMYPKSWQKLHCIAPELVWLF